MRRPAPRYAMLVLLAAALLGAVSGCAQRRSVGPAGSSGELPDLEINDFALTETDAGKPEWKLYARYAAEYSARNSYVARDLKVDFYDDQGARSSVLTAREGEINGRSRDMTARGNVVLVATEGTRLSSEELKFLNHDQKIVVPDDQLVTVQRGSDVLTGYGFESDPDLKHYEFKRRVQATVRSKVPLGEESGK